MHIRAITTSRLGSGPVGFHLEGMQHSSGKPIVVVRISESYKLSIQFSDENRTREQSGLGVYRFLCVEEEEEDFVTHLFSRHLALG